MKIENQVCTLEQAKKLKELGIVQDSLFVWFECIAPRSKKIEGYILTGFESTNLYTGNWWSAYTVAELGLMLGNEYNVERANKDYVRVSSIKVDNDFCVANLADALCQVVIEYIGDSTLQVARINHRLQS